MPDRSHRLLPLPSGASLSGGAPLPGGGPAPLAGGALLREHRSAPPHSDGSGSDSGPDDDGSGDSDGKGNGSDHAGDSSGAQDDNPFAAPPEGTPDRPWQPRRPEQDGGQGGSPWGQWSDRQPGGTPGGGFGDRPGRQQSGPEGPQSPQGGMRWDPTDPAQRRARYALLGGMWAFFFALFGWRYPALLLGALALYWGISSLHGAPRPESGTGPEGGGADRAVSAARRPEPARPQGPAPAGPGGGARPQATAAISGLVTAALALSIVAAGFAAQVIYRDYYTCVSDSLTTTAKHSCEDLLPKNLRPLLSEQR
ncbi:hypothetical protein [Streptomyces sp. NPDC058045]|uniref:hypothetical protein n=1 Tax=Streptomyces sp. NPDC058045 TaxID=3346311 RepID=UPI0036EA435C